MSINSSDLVTVIGIRLRCLSLKKEIQWKNQQGIFGCQKCDKQWYMNDHNRMN